MLEIIKLRYPAPILDVIVSAADRLGESLALPGGGQQEVLLFVHSVQTTHTKRSGKYPAKQAGPSAELRGWGRGKR